MKRHFSQKLIYLFIFLGFFRGLFVSFSLIRKHFLSQKQLVSPLPSLSNTIHTRKRNGLANVVEEAVRGTKRGLSYYGAIRKRFSSHSK